MELGLKGKQAIVTGGTKGIGRAITEVFVREGADVALCDAGAAHPGDFETLSDEDWQADLDVKLFSMIRYSRAVVPHIRARGGGRIINIKAVYGRYPDPTFFATSLNRAACLSFTKTLAIQLAPENILVNSVNPGFVVTPQWKNIHRRSAPHISEEEFFRRMAEKEVPLGRRGCTSGSGPPPAEQTRSY